MLPIQNLNGYDKPWPAGGGKNLLPTIPNGTYGTVNITFARNADGSYALTGATSQTSQRMVVYNVYDPSLGLTDQNDMIKHLPNGTYYCAVGGSGFRLQVYGTNTAGIDGIQSLFNGTSGTFVVDDTYAYNYCRLQQMENEEPSNTITLMICLDSETDKSFAPYENICQISGYTSATVTRTGKNLLDRNLLTSEVTLGGVTFTPNPDGSVRVHGTASQNVARNVASFYFKAGVNYLLSGCPSGGSESTYFLRVHGPSQNEYAINMADSGDGRALLFAEDILLYVDTRVGVGVTLDEVFKPMIRLASDTDPTYEPYNGDTYTVQFGDTIYGGTLDFTTGVLTATYIGVVFDGTETWAGNENRYFRHTVDNHNVSADNVSKRSCSHFANNIVTSSGTAEGYYAYTGDGAPTKIWMAFRPPVSIASTLDDWKAYLAAQYAAGTPVTAVTYVDNPTTVQLTPQEITTLYGTNNIWATTTTNQP